MIANLVSVPWHPLAVDLQGDRHVRKSSGFFEGDRKSGRGQDSGCGGQGWNFVHFLLVRSGERVQAIGQHDYGFEMSKNGLAEG
jgi:hypothetical protein